MSSDKEIWQCHVTYEHKHSHDNKGHDSCSNGCVSDEFARLEKRKWKIKENDTYQYEQDQDGEGDELYAVKGKGKGGFQGTCFKCGMRGHKADGCWQKGKGK